MPRFTNGREASGLPGPGSTRSCFPVFTKHRASSRRGATGKRPGASREGREPLPGVGESRHRRNSTKLTFDPEMHRRNWLQKRSKNGFKQFGIPRAEEFLNYSYKRSTNSLKAQQSDKNGSP
ncbi:hypothetical protein L596_013906 [Steinernema carpocapsae]|uniref:Uncharacterized protein n=1 Tax=Steinernema carpocapsae TaxID=34508 RepID=A0A4V6XWG9_STECR|nr:hypothetical protein L596_013906 [Steinernema carpocapsae]